MADDPVAFLRNAHERAELLAQAATPGPWSAEEHAEHGFRVGTADDRSWVAWTGEFDDEPESSRPDSVFIAANSPDKVLARIEVERELLVEHQVDDKGCCRCCMVEFPDEQWDCAPWPCRTVRLLAAGWGWVEE